MAATVAIVAITIAATWTPVTIFMLVAVCNHICRACIVQRSITSLLLAVILILVVIIIVIRLQILLLLLLLLHHSIVHILEIQHICLSHLIGHHHVTLGKYIHLCHLVHAINLVKHHLTIVYLGLECLIDLLDHVERRIGSLRL